jgi:very-short-patch-repair endonuclease
MSIYIDKRITTQKFQLRCSCIICKREVSAQNLQAHSATHFKVLNKCKQCGKDCNKRFCSTKCSAIYTNARKDWTKIKSGPQKGSIQPNRLTKAKFTKVIQCVICNRYHPKKGNTCSPVCYSAYASKLAKTRIHNGFNVSANRGRSKQSYLEKSFAEWLTINVPTLPVIAEQSFKRMDMVKTYFADFYFPSKNLIIELDGTQHKYTTAYDQERDEYISSAYNLNIIRISHKDYVSGCKIDYIKSILQ